MDFLKFPLLPFYPVSAEILRLIKAVSVPEAQTQIARWDRNLENRHHFPAAELPQTGKMKLRRACVRALRGCQ